MWAWVIGIGWVGTLKAEAWQGGWYLDGGGYWSGRLQVLVTNRTDRPMEGLPVPIRIGPNRGEADLVGQKAQAIRVAAGDGTELLFALWGPDGKEIRTGPIPAGSTLLLPADCPPQGKSAYWIYFDNPLAGEVPDFLCDRPGLVNGDLEDGEGDTPTGWVHDQPDENHRTSWTTENPRSGRRCVKTVVAEGASPSWIATRQSHIAVQPGARYRFRAWVRAEGVKGYAGWYLHLGNAQQPMISAPMVSAGGGTYDWKQVQLEFRVPAEADRLSVGTVLWGTGTAWFDLAELECLDRPGFEVEVSRPERLQVQELAAARDWPLLDGADGAFHRRAIVRVENFSDRPVEGLLVVDISTLNHRLGGRLDRQTLRWISAGDVGRGLLLADRMLLEASIPARTVLTSYLYYAPIGRAPAEPLFGQEQTSTGSAQQPLADGSKPLSGSQPSASGRETPTDEAKGTRSGGPGVEEYARLASSRRNLLQNPSFEAQEPFSAWQATPSGRNEKVQYGTDSPGAPGLGQRCARLQIPAGVAKAWRGWTQSVAVRPGASYLVAGWIRTAKLRQGNAQIHVHIHTSSGGLSRHTPMRSTGGALEGTTDWTLLSALFTMPEDAATLQVHLTTDGFGTIWYDGVLVTEVIPARIVGMEGRPVGGGQIAVWPVNPIVKIFPDEPAPPALCRNVPAGASSSPASGSQTVHPPSAEQPSQWPKPLQAGVPSDAGGTNFSWTWASNPQAAPVSDSGGTGFPGVQAAAVQQAGLSAVEVFLARNEQEAVQLAVRAGRTWAKVQVEIDPPHRAEGPTLPPPEVALVGYVPVDYPTNYYTSTAPRWHRKVPRSAPACDGFAGLWPDPLLPQNSFTLPANTTQAVWITFQTPKEAPAGQYEGRIRFWGQPDGASGGANRPSSGGPGGNTAKGNCLLAEIPYRVHVWNFTLPDQPHLKAIYDVRFGSGMKLWGKTQEEVYREVAEFLARRRLQPDAVRPEPIFRYKDGRVEADFTEFDKAAQWYFGQLGLRHSYMPWHFYLFGWGHPPKKVGPEAPYPGQPPYEKADRAMLRPEYKHLYQEALRLFWQHVKEKGWADRFVLYIADEPFFRQPEIRAQMKALCAMIHEVDPAIPIYSSTWHHVPEWDDALDVWGIGHYGIVPLEQMARLQSAGKRIWFTTDGQMCLDTPYCAVERLLPHYCFHYGAEAYEFWGVAWTTYDPYRYGWHAYIHQSDQPGKSYWVRYPNGDGYLLYPGRPIGHEGPVSSIRLEQAREGVEDYEYLYILREKLAALPAQSPAAQQAQRILEASAKLLSFPNPGGRYSSRILPDPDRLLHLRRQLAETIEALSAKP